MQELQNEFLRNAQTIQQLQDENSRLRDEASQAKGDRAKYYLKVEVKALERKIEALKRESDRLEGKNLDDPVLIPRMKLEEPIISYAPELAYVKKALVA